MGSEEKKKNKKKRLPALKRRKAWKNGVGMTDLEFLTEPGLAEEDPRVLISAVPQVFELAHALQYPDQLFIAHEADEGGSRST